MKLIGKEVEFLSHEQKTSTDKRVHKIIGAKWNNNENEKITEWPRKLHLYETQQIWIITVKIKVEMLLKKKAEILNKELEHNKKQMHVLRDQYCGEFSYSSL